MDAATPLVRLVVTTPDGVARAIDVARDVTAPPPASEPLDESPFSHGFTGRHDGGALPAPGRNVYSHVIDAVAEAKATTDAYLVSLLPAAAAAGATANEAGSAAKQRKKLRLSPDGSVAAAAAAHGGADAEDAPDALEEDGGS